MKIYLHLWGASEGGFFILSQGSSVEISSAEKVSLETLIQDHVVESIQKQGEVEKVITLGETSMTRNEPPLVSTTKGKRKVIIKKYLSS